MITFQQRMELNRAERAGKKAVKVSLWMSHGFTKEEAETMVNGASHADSIARNGGIWMIGNVPYYQAISKNHAEKIYLVTSETLPEPARLVK